MEAGDEHKILIHLRGYALGPEDPNQGRYLLNASDFKNIRLNFERFNAAVGRLLEHSLVEAVRSKGRYRYSEICLTTSGREKAEHLLAQDEIATPQHSASLFARYAVTTLIGRGTRGDVWRANDTMLKRDIAVKFVESTESGRDALAHARALAKVSHPNIVTVYEIIKLNHPKKKAAADAILMELVEGTTLTERLGRSMNFEQALQISQALISGIRAYHEKGLAHLDLHDDNIIIGSQGIKILDPIYYETNAFQSTVTRTTQQRRDISNVKDLILQMIHLSAVDSDRISAFQTATMKPTLEALSSEVEKVFSNIDIANVTGATLTPPPNWENAEVHRLTLSTKYNLARQTLDVALKGQTVLLESVSTMTILTRMVRVLGEKKAPESSWKNALEGVRKKLSDIQEEMDMVSRGVVISWGSTHKPLGSLKQKVGYIHGVSLYPIAGFSLQQIKSTFSSNPTQLRTFLAMNDDAAALHALSADLQNEVSAIETWAVPFLGRSK